MRRWDKHVREWRKKTDREALREFLLGLADLCEKHGCDIGGDYGGVVYVGRGVECAAAFFDEGEPGYWRAKASEITYP